jgi:hypothetical protein
LPVRFKLLALLLLFASPAGADWTGVAMDFADVNSDWKFNDGIREAQTSAVSFQIEEKAESELRVGLGIGYMSMRIVADTAAETRKFDGEYLRIYLRQPVRINESISLHGLLSYRYNTGRDNDEIDSAEIDWTETSLQIGVSLRFANYRLTPFTTVRHVDGDISDDDGTEVFDLDEPQSLGIRFDYFFDETSFLGIEVLSGGQAGGYLSFVRRY